MVDVLEEQKTQELVETHKRLLTKLLESLVPLMSKQLLEVSDASTMRNTFRDLQRYELIGEFKAYGNIYHLELRLP